MNQNTKTGLWLKLFETVIWSFFPIVTIFCYQYLGSLFTASISTIISCGFFAVVITYKKQWAEIKTKKAILPIMMATLFVAIIYYTLLFIGIKYTTAGNASIIFLMQTFFTFVILNAWKKEQSTGNHILGAILMVCGALLVIFPGKVSFNLGDILVLTAMAFPGVGNYYQKIARKYVSSATIMFYRNLIGSTVLFLLAISFEAIPTSLDLKNALLFLLINGIILLGYAKILWIEIIHRIPITVTTALSGATPLFTLLFAYLFLGETITIWQISALVPIIFGVILLTQIPKISTT